MVTLGSNDTALFLRTMETIPSHFLSHHVKKICLSVSVRPTHAERILTTCTGVTDLAFWVDYLGGSPSLSIVPFISPLPLRRLSIELAHFMSLFAQPGARHAWLNSLTHLDIIFWTHVPAPAVSHLDQLPSLTHLALRLRHNHPEENSLISILSACKCLKLLVILDEMESVEESVWTTDPRVVYIPYPPNIVREWESQARQDHGCNWSRAEDLVRRHTAQRESSYISSHPQPWVHG